MRSPVALSVVLVVALLAPAFPPASAAGGAPTWTVLVYMAADNDLEPAALVDLDEFALPEGSASKVLVLADRHAEYATGDEGEWTDTRIFLHTASGWTEEFVAGELNLGDPENLAAFIEYGYANHRSDRMALVLWDHGAGWMGVAADENPVDMLSLNELGQGIGDGLARANAGRFDLIGFDACLMATVEMLHAVSGKADYVVASEEYVPNNGWDYGALTRALGEGIEADALARRIVDDFIRFYRDEPDGAATTLAAYDLRGLPSFDVALARFDEALQAAPVETALHLASAIEDSVRITFPDETSRASVDLFDLLTRLSFIPDGTVARAAADVLASEEGLILHESHAPAMKGARGLARYAVVTEEELAASRETYQGIAPEDAAWLQTLEALSIRLKQEDDVAPSIDPLTVKPRPSAGGVGYNIASAIQDEHLSEVGLALVQYDASGNALVTQTIPVFATNGTGASGAHPLSFTWDLTMQALQSDEGRVPVPFLSDAAGAAFAEVHADLSRASGGEPSSVLLRFATATGRLIAAYDLSTYSAIPLRTGDRLSVTWTGVSPEGKPVVGHADPLEVGPSGVKLVRVFVPPGEWGVSLLAKDVAGNANLSTPIPVKIPNYPQGTPGEGTNPPTPPVSTGGGFSNALQSLFPQTTAEIKNATQELLGSPSNGTGSASADLDAVEAGASGGWTEFLPLVSLGLAGVAVAALGVALWVRRR